jgi:hypothetical protein
MPRYWIHINGSEADAAGLELADDKAAWSEAVATMCELLKGHNAARDDLRVEVRDQDGTVGKLTSPGG